MIFSFFYFCVSLIIKENPSILAGIWYIKFPKFILCSNRVPLLIIFYLAVLKSQRQIKEPMVHLHMISNLDRCQRVNPYFLRWLDYFVLQINIRWEINKYYDNLVRFSYRSSYLYLLPNLLLNLVRQLIKHSILSFPITNLKTHLLSHVVFASSLSSNDFLMSPPHTCRRM